MILNNIEGTIQTRYPTCPRPYFIASKNNLFYFTFDIKIYPKALQAYFYQNEVLDDVYCVQADTTGELAEVIYMVAMLNQLDF